MLKEFCRNVWRGTVVLVSVFNTASATLVNRITAWLSGVEIGAKSKFFGYSVFRVSKAGKLKVGHRCTFRSAASSNLIGINRPCIFSVHNDGVIEIGDSCGFSGTVIGCFKKITLGNNVRCGANTLITDSDWHLSDARVCEPREIRVEDNVWLGVSVIVLKGVTIGENTIIGAGSIVTTDIPANVIAAGNPCRVIKKLS